MFQLIIICPIGVTIGVADGCNALPSITILLYQSLEISEIGFHHTIVINDIGIRSQMIIKHKSLAIMFGQWFLEIIIFSNCMHK